MVQPEHELSFHPRLDAEDRRGILIVGRQPAISQSLAKHLGFRSWLPVHASSKGEALEAIAGDPGIFLALVDLAMPGFGGLEFIDALKENKSPCDVVLLTEYLDSNLAISLLKHGAFDYVQKPFRMEEILHLVGRVRETQALKAKAMAFTVYEETKRVERQNLIDFMTGLANVIDAKSPYTKEHSDRVAKYTKAFCRFLELPPDDIEDIAFGAKLHDIGKVGIPDRILESTGKLTREERKLMMDHPALGASILEPIDVMRNIIPIVKQHHENWDGSGYPDGVKGEDIPLGPRIVKITDYYDAITSVRPYREPLSQEQAFEILSNEAGKLLDPDLTPAFIALARTGVLNPSNISGVLPALPKS